MPACVRTPTCSAHARTHAGGISSQDPDAQARRIEELLNASKAEWKIVVGHHPVSAVQISVWVVVQGGQYDIVSGHKQGEWKIVVGHHPVSAVHYVSVWGVVQGGWQYGIVRETSEPFVKLVGWRRR